MYPIETDRFTAIVSQVLSIQDVTTGDKTDRYLVRYRGHLIGDDVQAFPLMRRLARIDLDEFAGGVDLAVHLRPLRVVRLTGPGNPLDAPQLGNFQETVQMRQLPGAIKMIDGILQSLRRGL